MFDKIKLKISSLTEISQAATEAITLSKKYNCMVTFSFNDKGVIVKSDTTHDDACNQYYRQLYKGERG